MQSRGWKLRFPVLFLLFVLVLVLRWFGPAGDPTPGANQSGEVTESAARDVRIYLPPLTNLTFFYQGEGNEYASFTRTITHASPAALQMEDASGTNLAQVVELTPEQLRMVWSEEEFYEAVSLLPEETRQTREFGRALDLILLAAPIVEGQSWTDAHYQREIIATDETVTVPLGTFYEVVVVKSRSLEAEDFLTYEYYAKNVGLIKRVSVSEGEEAYAIVSSLAHLTTPGDL